MADADDETEVAPLLTPEEEAKKAADEAAAKKELEKRRTGEWKVLPSTSP